MPKIFLFFFGPPGSGKGTQVDLLAEKLKLPVISPGELLRHEEDNNTALGKKIKPLIDKGKMVGDEIIEKLVLTKLYSQEASKGAVFDGFPRTISQHRFIMEKLDKISGPQAVVWAVYIKVSDKEVSRRLGKRRVCDCGASYHLVYNPTKRKGICDLCGKPTYIRRDDKPEVIKKRLSLYHKSVEPILDRWEKLGRLYRLDGERKINTIHQELLKFSKKIQMH